MRFLTISGKEFLPSKGAFRAITPELINTGEMLAHYNITREQLIDLAILIGTDFNEGIKGIGPKKALKLVSEFGSIENMPAEIQEPLTALAPAIRDIFLHPDVVNDYRIEFRGADTEGIMRFLCDEREFSRERVINALKRAFEKLPS